MRAGAARVRRNLPTVRAVVVTRPGGTEVLETAERPAPPTTADALLVRVAAAGVNFIDVYQREGIYPVPAPFVPGLEGAGTVEDVGANVSGFAPGDRVAWKNAMGSCAELVSVAATEAVPVPAGIADDTAAALLLQGLTAHYLSNSTYAVQPGDWVLVHAAAGGVGLLLTQLVRARGGHVVATAGSADKVALARSAGAERVVDYTREDFVAAAREATGGEGVAAVYDGVGRDTFDGSLAALRPRGTLALYGAASGQVPPFDIQRLNAGGSLFLTRPTLIHYTRTRQELLDRSAALFDAVTAGTLDVRIGHRYRLEQTRQAYKDLEGRRTTGKLLLLP